MGCQHWSAYGNASRSIENDRPVLREMYLLATSPRGHAARGHLVKWLRGTFLLRGSRVRNLVPPENRNFFQGARLKRRDYPPKWAVAKALGRSTSKTQASLAHRAVRLARDSTTAEAPWRIRAGSTLGEHRGNKLPGNPKPLRIAGAIVIVGRCARWVVGRDAARLGAGDGFVRRPARAAHAGHSSRCAACVLCRSAS
jgi:hypothetical protein